VILENSILVRTGWTGGRVYNINRKTGDIFWKTKDDIISNIAYSPQAIYLLRQRWTNYKDGIIKYLGGQEGFQMPN